MKFDLSAFTDSKYAMRCRTREEANIFLTYLHEHGRRWCTGKHYKNNKIFWDDYRNNTCYYFNKGTYGSYLNATRQDLVLEFSNFEWDDDMTLTEKDAKKFHNFLTECVGLESVVNL
jgi:hypothetical protein